MLKHQIYQSCTAEFTLTMSSEQSTYLAKITERSQTAVKSRTRTFSSKLSFLHFFAVVLGAFRVGKSIVLLDPILSKGSRTIFGKRPFLKFSKTGKRFYCHMSHRKRDDRNECIINFMIIYTHPSKCRGLSYEKNCVLRRWESETQGQ